MDQSFRMATELNALTRDLLYFADQYQLNPDAGPRIFATGIAPRLEEARVKLASCCEFEIIPKKRAQSERQTELSFEHSEGRLATKTD